MLKPIESIQALGNAIGWDNESIERKQDALLKALLNPADGGADADPVVVFAHGPEAVRMAAIRPDADQRPEWAIQTWNPETEAWQTKDTHPVVFAHKDAIIAEARNWHQPPSPDSIIEKWGPVGLSTDGDEIEAILDSRAKMAEFWYETKVVDKNHDDIPPWGFTQEVAESLFMRSGKASALETENFAEKIEVHITNFTTAWGENPYASPAPSAETTIMSDQPEKYTREQLQSMAMEAVSAYDHYDLEDTLEETPDADLLDIINMAKNKYEVSVSYEVWDEGAREHGETNDKGWAVERETVNIDDLEHYVLKYETTNPSSEHPETTPYIYFQSEGTTGDRAYFEQGESTYYSLHIHSVNGKELEPEDYQRVANWVGIEFENPVELKKGAPEMEVEDPIFGYYISLDERGDFNADVRNEKGETVYEIRAGNSLGEDESSIFEDGYMDNKMDLKGLSDFLEALKIIPKGSKVVSSSDFESELEERAEARSQDNSSSLDYAG